MFGQSLIVVAALSGAALAVMLAPTQSKAAIVAAGSNGGVITLGTSYSSTTAPADVNLCNPGFTKTLPVGQDCHNLTGGTVIGFPTTFFANVGNPQGPTPPFTNANSNPSLVVVNDTNYDLAQVVYGSKKGQPVPAGITTASGVSAPFTFTTTGSTSNIFQFVTVDPVANTLTFDKGNLPGLLPGQSFRIDRSFTVPADLANNFIYETAVLTLVSVPESSSVLSLVAFGALGTAFALKQKLKKS